MIKAERIKKIKLITNGKETYQVTFKSGEQYDIPRQGVGLAAFLDEVKIKLEQVKACLIVDTQTHHVLAACMRVKSSWANFAFTKEMDERQARGLMECLARLQGIKKRGAA